MAAYLVSQALGFDFVPLTILRDGPLGPGSLQQYIDHDPNSIISPSNLPTGQRLRPVALFDLLINNADRKGGHILLQKRTRKLYLIDHGLCFHAEDKLRTVIWDFAGEAMPPELISALETFHEACCASTCPRPCSSISPRRNSLRWMPALEALLGTPGLPTPPEDRRSFPYPPL